VQSATFELASWSPSRPTGSLGREVFIAELVKRKLRAVGASVALVEGICGDDPFAEMAGTVMDAGARMERRMCEFDVPFTVAIGELAWDTSTG